MAENIIRYGGQALMEGVMMQGPEGKALAVRQPNGELTYKIVKFEKKRGSGFSALPGVRGCVNFAHAMVSGVEDLGWSANASGEDDEQLTKKEMAMAIIMALGLTVVFFIALPVFLMSLIHPYVGDFGRSLAEGLLRAALFLGYVAAISRMDDIKRIFRYHGAEHMTINAYEDGAELTPESVRRYSRINVRCGTSFIFMTMIIMVILFTFIGQTVAWKRVLIKLILLPVVAGISYEVFRLPLKYPKNWLVKALVWPGLMTQKLTTATPDDSMLEAAIAALTNVPGFVPRYTPMESDCPLEQAAREMAVDMEMGE